MELDEIVNAVVVTDFNNEKVDRILNNVSESLKSITEAFQDS